MPKHELDFRSGEQLLRQWGCRTNEDRLHFACSALMNQLDQLHMEKHGQSLKNNLNNEEVFCSCADAYRMGHEALKGSNLNG